MAPVVCGSRSVYEEWGGGDDNDMASFLAEVASASEGVGASPWVGGEIASVEARGEWRREIWKLNGWTVKSEGWLWAGDGKAAEQILESQEPSDKICIW